MFDFEAKSLVSVGRMRIGANIEVASNAISRKHLINIQYISTINLG